jgi:DNA-binding NarL/FixJ family response regulator
MDNIRIILVDDHEIVRRGLRGLLDITEGIEVVGEGSDGNDALPLVERYKPDVILMDLIMPGMNGVEATRSIMSVHPEARILILSSFGDDDYLFPVLEAGASGYVLKDIAPDDLVEAIRDVHAGKTRLHPDLAAKLVDRLRHQSGTESEPSRVSGELTDRELEVLRCICDGQSNKEIADTLNISPMTVKTHISNLLSKLDLQDRTQAAVYAIRSGLVSRD